MVQVWALKNATINAGLGNACFRSLTGSSTTPKPNLSANMLASMSLSQVSDEATLREIAAWMSPPETRLEERERLGNFFDLSVPILDLIELSLLLVINVARGKTDLKLPSQCQTSLLNTWKDVRASLLAQSPTKYPSDRYAACPRNLVGHFDGLVEFLFLPFQHQPMRILLWKRY